MKRTLMVPKVALALALCTGAVLTSGRSEAAKPPSSNCPNQFLVCADVWNPVICPDGKVYSNQCYADRACATGCVPYGGGPTPLD